MKALYKNNFQIGRKFKTLKGSTFDEYFISDVNSTQVNISWDEKSILSPSHYSIESVKNLFNNNSWVFIENEYEWKKRIFQSCNCLECNIRRKK